MGVGKMGVGEMALTQNESYPKVVPRTDFGCQKWSPRTTFGCKKWSHLTKTGPSRTKFGNQTWSPGCQFWSTQTNFTPDQKFSDMPDSQLILFPSHKGYSHLLIENQWQWHHSDWSKATFCPTGYEYILLLITWPSADQVFIIWSGDSALMYT